LYSLSRAFVTIYKHLHIVCPIQSVILV
jgi:hypothetical protein